MTNKTTLDHLCDLCSTTSQPTPAVTTETIEEDEISYIQNEQPLEVYIPHSKLDPNQVETQNDDPQFKINVPHDHNDISTDELDTKSIIKESSSGTQDGQDQSHELSEPHGMNNNKTKESTWMNDTDTDLDPIDSRATTQSKRVSITSVISLITKTVNTTEQSVDPDTVTLSLLNISKNETTSSTFSSSSVSEAQRNSSVTPSSITTKLKTSTDIHTTSHTPSSEPVVPNHSSPKEPSTYRTVSTNSPILSTTNTTQLTTPTPPKGSTTVHNVSTTGLKPEMKSPVTASSTTTTSTKALPIHPLPSNSSYTTVVPADAMASSPTHTPSGRQTSSVAVYIVPVLLGLVITLVTMLIVLYLWRRTRPNNGKVRLKSTFDPRDELLEKGSDVYTVVDLSKKTNRRNGAFSEVIPLSVVLTEQEQEAILLLDNTPPIPSSLTAITQTLPPSTAITPTDTATSHLQADNIALNPIYEKFPEADEDNRKQSLVSETGRSSSPIVVNDVNTNILDLDGIIYERPPCSNNDNNTPQTNPLPPDTCRQEQNHKDDVANNNNQETESLIYDKPFDIESDMNLDTLALDEVIYDKPPDPCDDDEEKNSSHPTLDQMIPAASEVEINENLWTPEQVIYERPASLSENSEEEEDNKASIMTSSLPLPPSAKEASKLPPPPPPPPMMRPLQPSTSSASVSGCQSHAPPPVEYLAPSCHQHTPQGPNWRPFHDYDPVYVPTSNASAMNRRVDSTGYVRTRPHSPRIPQVYEEINYGTMSAPPLRPRMTMGATASGGQSARATPPLIPEPHLQVLPERGQTRLQAANNVSNVTNMLPPRNTQIGSNSSGIYATHAQLLGASLAPPVVPPRTYATANPNRAIDEPQASGANNDDSYSAVPCDTSRTILQDIGAQSDYMTQNSPIPSQSELYNVCNNTEQAPEVPEPPRVPPRRPIGPRDTSQATSAQLSTRISVASSTGSKDEPQYEVVDFQDKDKEDN